ncbi:MAG: hypothetical protein K0Q65_1871 [Clostridia bacterium]|jgi:uncharacterized protein with FMN-binding domain|nr:hypothetical protein [Clostridia bacterium]
MKKALLFVLTLMLIFSFSACANQPEAPDTTTPDTTTPDTTTPDTTAPGTDKGALKDGTYEGKGDKWQYGDESATVVVSEGKMAQITLKRLTTEGQEVNYEEWTGAEFEGQVRPNLKQFREDLAKAMIAKQSTAVDDIAGATVSSKNWKLAVDRALEQAEVK